MRIAIGGITTNDQIDFNSKVELDESKATSGAQGVGGQVSVEDMSTAAEAVGPEQQIAMRDQIYSVKRAVEGEKATKAEALASNFEEQAAAVEAIGGDPRMVKNLREAAVSKNLEAKEIRADFTQEQIDHNIKLRELTKEVYADQRDEINETLEDTIGKINGRVNSGELTKEEGENLRKLANGIATGLLESIDTAEAADIKSINGNINRARKRMEQLEGDIKELEETEKTIQAMG